jgi:uncharacterized protein YdhG (YjbR/CyaY superfamily)
MEEERVLQQFRACALAAWADYQPTGMHASAEEADAWLENSRRARTPRHRNAMRRTIFHQEAFSMAVKKASAENGKAEVEAYLAQVPEPARTTLEKMRAMIRAAAPKEATEAISYKIPSFQYQGALVWYAAFKKHCSFFPADHSLVEEFAEDLKNCKVLEGTIQFPVDKPLSKALVKRIVQARVALNQAKEMEKH